MRMCGSGEAGMPINGVCTPIYTADIGQRGNDTDDDDVQLPQAVLDREVSIISLPALPSLAFVKRPATNRHCHVLLVHRV